jgi:hypothetical protein
MDAIYSLIILVFLTIFCLTIFSLLSSFGRAQDNREPYVRAGRDVLALRVVGEVGDVPDHTRYIHDGTPHQNPAVRTVYGLKWFVFLIIKEERYYPITDNGGTIDYIRIRERINAYKLYNHQEAELTTMPPWALKQAIQRENATQLGRGVPVGRLIKKGL